MNGSAKYLFIKLALFDFLISSFSPKKLVHCENIFQCHSHSQKSLTTSILGFVFYGMFTRCQGQGYGRQLSHTLHNLSFLNYMYFYFLNYSRAKPDVKSNFKTTVQKIPIYM